MVMDAILSADLKHSGHDDQGPATIRPAVAPDLTAIAAIYAHEVRTGISTFDLEPPPRSYWEARLASTEPGDHLLVAESAAGVVVGYAYATAYRPRAAYARTRETSVYVAEGARGQGVGRALYDALLALLARRRRAHRGRPGRHAEPWQRGAARGDGLPQGRHADRGGPQVRELDRHRAGGSAGSSSEQQLVEPPAHDEQADQAHHHQVDHRDRRRPGRRARSSARGTARRRGRAASPRRPSAAAVGKAVTGKNVAENRNSGSWTRVILSKSCQLVIHVVSAMQTAAKANADQQRGRQRQHRPPRVRPAPSPPSPRRNAGGVDADPRSRPQAISPRAMSPVRQRASRASGRRASRTSA